MMRQHLSFLPIFVSLLIGGAVGFTAPRTPSNLIPLVTTPITALHAEASDDDPSEIIARRLIVTGDVDGGYYRSCVRNEVSMIYIVWFISFYNFAYI